MGKSHQKYTNCLILLTWSSRIMLILSLTSDHLTIKISLRGDLFKKTPLHIFCDLSDSSTFIECLDKLRWTLLVLKPDYPQEIEVQYIPRNMYTVFALLCFVVVIHWLIFPYPSGLLHWHCGNLTIAPVPAKQPWWIWINTSCEFIMNDCITTTKQSTTKPCAYFLGYTVNTMLLIPRVLYSFHCQIISNNAFMVLNLQHKWVHDFMSSTSKDFNYLCHLSVDNLHCIRPVSRD